MNALALSDRLREATREMHRLAERSDFVGAMLAGRLPRAAYCAYLRNLQALYAALEHELESLSPRPAWIVPGLFRREALAADLDALAGAEWPAIALVPAIEAYAARLAEIARTEPHRLAAHAYVRYLGDLSGGQVIGKVIRRAYAAGSPAGTAFYEFPDDPDTTKAAIRATLDAYGEAVGPACCAQIEREAVEAFGRHRDFFAQLRAAAPAAA